ncbi:hypothetical protein [Glycomyces artemisiae]|uniref:Uncharacterized protein n=1 Tax=Glycomyces artemisiae TaxID=1076443 RepID=A0A2T0UF80_9ACTN|nr:hypothetical protein [Glycomyces artemisiae]PRY56477.1 hypothetical protein B0I28_109126 [Glycomyces artemisiae]
MAELRVIATGGRDLADRVAVAAALEAFELIYVHGFAPGEITLVHGDCKAYRVDGIVDPDRSADQLADQEARLRGWRTEPHPVREVHRRRWGPKNAYLKRNQAMVDMGALYVLAFDGGTGTAHCVQCALTAQIPVLYAHELLALAGPVPVGGGRVGT